MESYNGPRDTGGLGSTRCHVGHRNRFNCAFSGGYLIIFTRQRILEIKSYSQIFVQEIVSGILARGFLPDLKASEYGEWTFIFTDY